MPCDFLSLAVELKSLSNNPCGHKEVCGEAICLHFVVTGEWPRGIITCARPKKSIKVLALLQQVAMQKVMAQFMRCGEPLSLLALSGVYADLIPSVPTGKVARLLGDHGPFNVLNPQVGHNRSQIDRAVSSVRGVHP